MRVDSFTLTVGKHALIRNFTYDFKQDIIYNLYGENGAGKSSFAKAIAGYIPYSGDSEFRDKNIGLVASYTNIPDEISVKSLITFLVANSKETNDYKTKLYELCKVDNVINRKKIRVLSDGEKKKLMIYAALISRKEVLVLDEYASNLDRQSAAEMRSFIVELHSRLQFVCLNITHSIEDARSIHGQILYLNREQKTIIPMESVEQLTQFM